ncbi:hypothetical protein cypCar_00016058, partial [Cyprinus carpio]
LRLLQKEQHRAQALLNLKLKEQREQMQRRFDQEMNAKKKYYDTELETLEKQQKQTIERMETEHTVKQEVEKLPRSQRKESLKIKMNNFQQLKSDEEEKFLADQREFLDSTLKSIIAQNKREISETERQCLIKKQDLLREREATVWDLEEKSLHERHQLLKQQLKDQYFLQRHQLLKKHEKFSRLEEKRQKAERLHQQQKHENQMKEKISECEGNARELQQLQNEKCHLLIENETQRLKAVDEQHNQQLKEWREHLKPRKKVCPPLDLSLAHITPQNQNTQINYTLQFKGLGEVLEEELNLKKKEQELFFKMSEESQCQNVGSPNKVTKFLPYIDSSST